MAPLFLDHRANPWLRVVPREVKMLIVMSKDATGAQIQNLTQWIKSAGLGAKVARTEDRTLVGIVGDGKAFFPLWEKAKERFSHVEEVVEINCPYPLASRHAKTSRTLIEVGGVKIGSDELVVMAGPCSVESEAQLMEAAYLVKKAGGHVLRGGAFKPRSSPYSFQGLGERGLKLLRKAADTVGLPVVTEVMSTEDVPLVEEYADILQIGTRNAQNFPLLKRVGRSFRPVLLKRGMMSTIEEFLMAAEYILSEGNTKVILCERGIRTFETATRSTLDISAVPVLKELTHLPIVVDPSHAAGQWRFVVPLARAAVAAGADGLLVEVHPEPEKALCDGAQSLKPEIFYALMDQIQSLKAAMSQKRSWIS